MNHAVMILGRKGVTMTDLLTTADAARILGVVPATVRLLERTGKLPALKTPGGQRLFQRQDVQRVADDRRKLAGGSARSDGIGEEPSNER
jgi:excisionase family DNA binding protein